MAGELNPHAHSDNCLRYGREVVVTTAVRWS